MTQEQQLLEHHIKHAGDALVAVRTQYEALRAELAHERRRAEDAEASRDTIRAHAQAALEKYRDDKARTGELETLLEAAIHSWDSDDENLTPILETARDLLSGGDPVEKKPA
jgi:phage shock protein A